MTKTANTPRDVAIQVPGEAAPVVEQAQAVAAVDAQPVRRTRPQEDPATEIIKERVGELLDQKTAEADGEATIPADVMERARAEARAELSQQMSAAMQAASSVLEEADPLPVATRRSYAKMRAADIDPTKLTAPVMTLDGWLCPPAPEKK